MAQIKPKNGFEILNGPDRAETAGGARGARESAWGA